MVEAIAYAGTDCCNVSVIAESHDIPGTARVALEIDAVWTDPETLRRLAATVLQAAELLDKINGARP